MNIGSNIKKLKDADVETRGQGSAARVRGQRSGGPRLQNQDLS